MIRLSVLTGALLFAFAALVSTGTQPAPRSELQAKATDLPAIVAALKAGGRVRVIAEFAVPPLRGITKRALAMRGRQVKARQDAILASFYGSVPAASDTRVSRMKITPAFSVWVSAAELQKLAQDVRVIRIFHDGTSKPTLSDTVPLIGASNLQKRFHGTGAGFIVVVMDTGVESAHDFLRPRVIWGACFGTSNGEWQSTCRNGVTADEGKKAGEPCTGASGCWHGTHVAGIAAGKLRDAPEHPGAPKVGVAPEAEIVSINIASRKGDQLEFFDSDVIRALEWVLARQSGFFIYTIASVNMSFGNGTSHNQSCDNDSMLTDPINQLRDSGIAAVIAAGNDGYRNGVSHPGCISTAITVSSTTKDDTVSGFSNVGDLVDILAPGGCSGCEEGRMIHSSVTGNGFRAESGTSMAAPHVAGAWAALRSVDPTKSFADIEAALKVSGKPIPDGRTNGIYTKPRIQVDAAAQVVMAADSRADFSTQQGDNRWHYGYVRPVENPGKFRTLVQTGQSDHAWTHEPPHDFWTCINAANQIPNGTNGNGGRQPIEEWATRRWISPANEHLYVYGELGGAGAGGGVIIGSVLVDGVTKFNSTQPSNLQTLFGFDVDVSRGAKVDMVLAPYNHDDVNTTTPFWLKIAKNGRGVPASPPARADASGFCVNGGG